MEQYFTEYAVLKERIKILTNQAEAVGKIITENLNKAGETSVETNVGKFTISRRKAWTYPDNIVEIEETLKAEKAKAQSTGDATYEESDTLLFKSANI